MSQNLKIKKMLIANNIKKDACEKCNISVWLNQKLSLELHHIDGNNQNNKIENLQLLCPNCHSLTSNYRNRGRKNKTQKTISELDEQSIIKVIIKCQSIKEVIKILGLKTTAYSYQKIRNIISKNNIKLMPRQLTEKEIEHKLKLRKVIRPSKEELRKLIWTKPATAIAKDFNVSDKAIENWCKFYAIKKPNRGYWQKLNGTPKETRTLKSARFKRVSCANSQ